MSAAYFVPDSRFGFPLSGQALGFCDLGSSHLGCYFVPRACVLLLVVTRSARNGQIYPKMSCYVILRHALAKGVHDAEVALRTGITLFGGLEIPLSRFGVILRHALAMAYMRPRLNCALASPCSAALRYHFRASA